MKNATPNNFPCGLRLSTLLVGLAATQLSAAAGCSRESRQNAPQHANDQTVVTRALALADVDWIEVEQSGQGMTDTLGDGNNNGREIVGPTDTAVYVAASDTHFFVRLRLDSDPTQGGSMRAYGWGLLFDTDGDFDAYEYSLMIDGT